MNQFSELLGAFEQKFDEQFGETFLVTPMKPSKTHVGSPDESNPPYTLVGVLDDEGSMMGVVGTRYKAKVDMNIAGKNSVISFSAAQFCASKPMLRKDWTIETIGSIPKKHFRVGDVRPDGESRVHVFIEAAAQ